MKVSSPSPSAAGRLPGHRARLRDDASRARRASRRQPPGAQVRPRRAALEGQRRRLVPDANRRGPLERLARGGARGRRARRANTRAARARVAARQPVLDRARPTASRCARSAGQPCPRVLRLEPGRQDPAEDGLEGGLAADHHAGELARGREDPPRKKPAYADALRFAVVHHTAGSNSYSRAQSASIVRGIERYHVLANGWDDIGYNFLVDKYGQVFEGRWGGVDRNVVGAHAQGFNQGSAGVALIGTYDSASITPAARAALDPAPRLAPGRGARRSALDLQLALDRKPEVPGGAHDHAAHDLGAPGHGLHELPGQPALRRAAVASRAPSRRPACRRCTPPRPRAHRASSSTSRAGSRQSLPWSVTVTQPDGNIVGSGQGEGTTIDWTWDARTIPAGKYLYAIDAGPTVRPATGIVTGTTSRSMLTALAKPALFTPNGDGKADSTLVRYQVREPAIVTGTLVDAFGTPITTLFVESKTKGSYAFRWDATGIADGRYGIVLTARNAIGIETTATLAVIVDRTTRRLPGLAAGLLAERRRPAATRRASASRSTSPPGRRSRSAAGSGRSARSSRASSSLGSSRSTGTAASGAESASTSSGPTCGSPRR